MKTSPKLSNIYIIPNHQPWAWDVAAVAVATVEMQLQRPQAGVVDVFASFSSR